MKSIVVEVDAYHNVEDFRPYKFRFKDKGSKKENLKVALYRAILREGDWNGWFSEDCGELYGLEKEIESTINKMVDDLKYFTDVEKVVISRKTDDGGSVVENERDYTRGLVIWIIDKENNIGFGIGDRIKYDGTVDLAPLSNHHTDKYEVKWISIK